MRYRIFILTACAALLTQSAGAEQSPEMQAIERAAHASFDEMPAFVTADAPDSCGAGDGVHPRMAYCTNRNEILLGDLSDPGASLSYELAHLYGHAVQVRHGVADIALRTIRARRAEEEELRGWVTRQAECIAGFIHARSGLPELDLLDLFDAEPMTDSHWGREPLAVGPQVSIGLAARAEWFAIGQMGDISKCAVEEFGADLLVEALK